MSKRIDKTGRTKGESRHVRMHHWVMEKPAWKALKALERAIYLAIAARYNGSNNGRISYSVREAAIEMQITKSPAALALNNLEDAGFIVCNTKGGFNRKNRHATEWLLTEFNDDVTGEIAKKDFVRWDGKFRDRKPRDRTPKIQNTVLPAGRQVLPAGQNGAASRTIEGEIPPDSPASRTVKPDLPSLSVPPAGHIYSTSGEQPQQATKRRGRSKPSSKPESSSPSAQPESPKAKPSRAAMPDARQPSAVHLLETRLMKNTMRKLQ